MLFLYIIFDHNGKEDIAFDDLIIVKERDSIAPAKLREKRWMNFTNLKSRDDYYNARDEDDELRLKGETEVIVAKNKFGPVGIVHIIFRANIPKFYPVVRSDKFDIF